MNLTTDGTTIRHGDDTARSEVPQDEHTEPMTVSSRLHQMTAADLRQALADAPDLAVVQIEVPTTDGYVRTDLDMGLAGYSRGILTLHPAEDPELPIPLPDLEDDDWYGDEDDGEDANADTATTTSEVAA